MTLLSVVVPVHRVQGFLRECLDSVLDQGPDDLELIAVDDCSPDGSGVILAEYAARDPRVRVIPLRVNVGLGKARNVGLDAANGEYVWFLDSDDWLAEGAVPAVLRRLRATRPDVLVVDHVREHWDGRVVRSGLSRAHAGAPEVFSAQERPRVLKVLHTAWNKVVRRALLLDLGLRFGAGWYEDVSYSYPVLIGARRISILDRVCVHYRQRRVGAITRTVGDRHFELFGHWERVFELLDDWGPRVDPLRPAVFARMVWHYLTVLGNSDRVPARSRRAFFARAAANYARYRPPGGYEVPGGVAGVKHRLLAADAWRTFSALRTAMRVRDRSGRVVLGVARGVLGLARRALSRVRFATGVAVYHLHRLLPPDRNLAVYAAYWYRGYACNPAAVYEKARELAPRVRGVWVVRRDRRHSIPAGVPYVVAGSLRSYRTLARAHWLVNNVNFPGFAAKRPGSVHLQTHHGTPVKVMGIDQRRYPAGTGHDYAALLRRCDRWDYSLSANALSTQAWERQYPCGYQTLEVGHPRNDVLATADPARVATARTAVGVTPEDLVLLYAPTHRGHHPSYRPPFDADDVVDALGPGGRLLVRRHYLDAGLPPVTGNARDVSAYEKVEELYLAADILVTDYSSAMVDYAVLDRPIIVYAPDWAAYRSTRGVTFDLLAFPPGVVVTSLAELLEAIRTRSYASPTATAARAAFRARFCALDDGRAAERVVRRVFLGESGPSVSLPAQPARPPAVPASAEVG